MDRFVAEVTFAVADIEADTTLQAIEKAMTMIAQRSSLLPGLVAVTDVHVHRVEQEQEGGTR